MGFKNTKFDPILIAFPPNNRNIDVDYYTFISTESPLKSAIYHDINNNQFIYTKKILDVLKAKPDMCKNICKKYDKFLDNNILGKWKREKTVS